MIIHATVHSLLRLQERAQATLGADLSRDAMVRAAKAGWGERWIVRNHLGQTVNVILWHELHVALVLSNGAIPTILTVLRSEWIMRNLGNGSWKLLSRPRRDRKAEKTESRAADEKALLTGEKTPEELREENAHFARLNVTHIKGRLA